MKFVWFLSLAFFLVLGCAKGVDTTQPVSQVQKEAEMMSLAELESTAKAYLKAIEAKKTELEKIQGQLREIPFKEMFGEKAKRVKESISKISAELTELKKRFDIYAAKFKELDGNISKLQL